MKTIKVPADDTAELEVVEVDSAYPGLKDRIGGWIERVGTDFTLQGGDRLVFVVDEEGMYKTLPLNSRAMAFYPGYIYGDAYFMAEGMVMQDEGYEEPDFKGLPDNFTPDDLMVIHDRVSKINAGKP